MPSPFEKAVRLLAAVAGLAEHECRLPASASGTMAEAKAFVREHLVGGVVYPLPGNRWWGDLMAVVETAAGEREARVANRMPEDAPDPYAELQTAVQHVWAEVVALRQQHGRPAGAGLRPEEGRGGGVL